ncbi:MAG: hypothetical protein IKO78_05630 [Bacilli bacterium]|nr:hypothetical protein [Bacilli bacterium]
MEKNEILEARDHLLKQIREANDKADAVVSSNVLQDLVDHQDIAVGKSYVKYYPLNNRDVYDFIISSLPANCLISGHFLEPYPMNLSTGESQGNDHTMNFAMLDDNTIVEFILHESLGEEVNKYRIGVMICKVASPITLQAKKAKYNSKDKYDVDILLNGFFPEELTTNVDYTAVNGLPLAQVLGTVDISNLPTVVERKYGIVEANPKQMKMTSQS